MIDAIYIATSGMKAEQAEIDNISNNLANLNTNAFKKSRVTFEDLMYRDLQSVASDLQAIKNNTSTGLGTAVTAVTKDFSSGDLKATQNPLDIAIQGEGFLEVVLENGEYAYTRNGALRVMEDGMLASIGGERLSASIRIPTDSSSLTIQKDGTVMAQVEGEAVEIGQLELATFVNPVELEALGDGLYLANENSGRALYSRAGENGTGKIQQGFLESSNVDLVEEMMALMVAQRAYEVNSQIVRASDEILRINNNLRS